MELLTIKIESEFVEQRDISNQSSYTYMSIVGFLEEYYHRTLTPLPKWIFRDAKDFETSDPALFNVCKSKLRWQKEERNKGYYAPDFPDEELLLVTVGDFLVYNRWQSDYALTMRGLHDWLISILRKYQYPIVDIMEDEDRIYNEHTLRENSLEKFLKTTQYVKTVYYE